MYKELYQYLVLHKQLNVPGIGTFMVERRPADIDIANRVVNPPAYTIALHHGQLSPSIRLYNWLAGVLNISEREAVIRFNDFAFDLKEKVLAGHAMQWTGLGTLTKGLAGEIRFDALKVDEAIGEPVPAVKVIRENAEHKIRVGEDERTSTQMLELLNPLKKNRSYRWIIGFVLVVTSIIFVIWYFATHGLNASATGSQQKVTPKATTATYKVLQ